MRRISTSDLDHILQYTADIWNDLKGKSILLTGGTGFIGKWILESFIYANEKLNLKASITCISRNPELFLEEFPFFNYYNSVKFIRGDVANFDYNLTEKFQFVIHAATSASDHLNKNNPLLMLDTITLGTKNLLEFSIKQPLEGFLFLSSGAVYGRQPLSVSHIREDDFFKVDFNNPNSAYAEGKRIGELYCSIFHKEYNIPIKIARCFAFVGPYLPLDTHFAIGNFINNVLNNEDILIKGDGKTVRSYMYASDLIIWLWTILMKGQNIYPYNVGSDESISLDDLANTLLKISKKNNLVKILNPLSNSEYDIYVPNLIRSFNLNLSIKISLEEAFVKTLEFNNNLFVQ